MSDPVEAPAESEPVGGMLPLLVPRILGIVVRAAVPLGILTAGIVAFLYLSVEPEETKAEKEEEKPLRTNVEQVQRRDYQVVIQTHGIVQPHNEVTLSAQVAGEVTVVSPLFEVGAYFEQDDVLIELDSRDYKTALAIAEASRLSSESALALAKQNHDRLTELWQTKNVSEAEFHASEAALKQAEAQRDSAKAQVEQAKRDLERTTIRAPFSGRVRQKSVGVGQTVGSGAPLGTVFAVEFAEVRLPISSRELQFLTLPELADDPPVRVALRDAINLESDVVWTGKIVRTEGTLDQDSLELYAIAQVDDPFGRKSQQPPLRIGPTGYGLNSRQGAGGRDCAT